MWRAKVRQAESKPRACWIPRQTSTPQFRGVGARWRSLTYVLLDSVDLLDSSGGGIGGARRVRKRDSSVALLHYKYRYYMYEARAS